MIVQTVSKRWNRHHRSLKRSADLKSSGNCIFFRVATPESRSIDVAKTAVKRLY